MSYRVTGDDDENNTAVASAGSKYSLNSACTLTMHRVAPSRVAFFIITVQLVMGHFYPT